MFAGGGPRPLRDPSRDELWQPSEAGDRESVEKTFERQRYDREKFVTSKS
jgi:hypothetical protein